MQAAERSRCHRPARFEPLTLNRAAPVCGDSLVRELGLCSSANIEVKRAVGNLNVRDHSYAGECSFLPLAYRHPNGLGSPIETGREADQNQSLFGISSKSGDDEPKLNELI